MMPIVGQPAPTNRAMARKVGIRRTGSGRRIATIACLSALAAVAVIGVLHPLSAAGGGQPAATNALSSSSGVGSVWGNGDTTAGPNWLDLVTKLSIVVVLLFITLRVLSRMGAGSKKNGGRMQVLESRTLAPKASLHLVAIGDRRLVVGLTPSGMVSLAELDASELGAEPAAETADGAVALGGVAATGPARPTFGASLNSALWPLDALTGRLATFLSGGRVR